MFPPTIIPTLNVFKYSQLRLVACFKINMINHLTFQRFEKAFGHGIVPAVPFSAARAAPSYFARRVTPLIDPETQCRHIVHPDQNERVVRHLAAYFSAPFEKPQCWYQRLSTYYLCIPAKVTQAFRSKLTHPAGG